MLLHAVRVAGGVNALRHFLEPNDDVTVFDFDLRDPTDPCYEKNLLRAALSLKCNIGEKYLEEELKVLHGKIDDNPKLKKMWNYKENGKFLDALLLKLCKISLMMEVNKQWSKKNLDAKKELPKAEVYVNPVGFNVDPYSALMNGSCCPNIRIISVENKNVWVAVAPMKAGEQLFKSYGVEFISGPSERVRRALLQQKFGYYCKCIACVEDFPPICDLEGVDESFTYDADDLLDYESAKEKLKMHCDYVNENFEKFPFKELCYSMSMIVFKMAAIAKPMCFDT